MLTSFCDAAYVAINICPVIPSDDLPRKGSPALCASAALIPALGYVPKKDLSFYSS